jgi:hypothetical protein
VPALFRWRPPSAPQAQWKQSPLFVQWAGTGNAAACGKIAAGARQLKMPVRSVPFLNRRQASSAPKAAAHNVPVAGSGVAEPGAGASTVTLNSVDGP